MPTTEYPKENYGAQPSDSGNAYLLMKGGLYFRPFARGYTRNIFDAGIYERFEAIAHSDDPGVSLVSLTTLRGAIAAEKARLEAELGQLQARIDYLDEIDADDLFAVRGTKKEKPLG